MGFYFENPWCVYWAKHRNCYSFAYYKSGLVMSIVVHKLTNGSFFWRHPGADSHCAEQKNCPLVFYWPKNDRNFEHEKKSSKHGGYARVSLSEGILLQKLIDWF